MWKENMWENMKVVNMSLVHQEKELMKLLKENERNNITIKELADKLNYSESHTQSKITRLRDTGLAKRVNGYKLTNLGEQALSVALGEDSINPKEITSQEIELNDINDFNIISIYFKAGEDGESIYAKKTVEVLGKKVSAVTKVHGDDMINLLSVLDESLSEEIIKLIKESKTEESDLIG